MPFNETTDKRSVVYLDNRVLLSMRKPRKIWGNPQCMLPSEGSESGSLYIEWLQLQMSKSTLDILGSWVGSRIKWMYID